MRLTSPILNVCHLFGVLWTLTIGVALVVAPIFSTPADYFGLVIGGPITLVGWVMLRFYRRFSWTVLLDKGLNVLVVGKKKIIHLDGRERVWLRTKHRISWVEVTATDSPPLCFLPNWSAYWAIHYDGIESWWLSLLRTK